MCLCHKSHEADICILQVDALEAEATQHSGVLEAEAALFGAFKQEWSLKLAKALGAVFARATARYRSSLDAFSSQDEPAR